MASRKPFVGGNWKMNLDKSASIALAEGVADAFSATDAVDVVVCPPFPYLGYVAETFSAKGSGIKVGAQDVSNFADGAYTGEVSLNMLKDLGVGVVLTGHSERRHVIGESDTLVNDKTLAALEAGLEVILCVGEKIEQREAGQTDAINIAQTAYGLAGVSAEQMSKVTIAYEPVWAIGTGKTATPEDAQSAHAAIRAFVATLYNDEVAAGLRIQYGGSMKPGNAPELLSQTDIDGGLIGGASLKPADFVAILDAANASVGV